LLPAAGDEGMVVVDASVPGTLEVVVEVADEVLLQADAPTPMATTPRATSNLRTMRGYLRGPAGTLAPVSARLRSGRHSRAQRPAQLSPADLQM